jgi:predicted nucleic acid-binding protein
MTNKIKIYLDTSVFGGYYDEEFEQYTKPLFDRLANDEFILLFSNLTQDELEPAPQQVKDLVTQIKAGSTQFLDTSDEAVELANTYITEKVVGETSYSDCLHIALATIHKADYLVSWNFKHIVNVQRIRGYNAINLKNGYSLLEIRSPREFAL